MYTNMAVTGFSLAADDSLLNSLDTVYFAIDLTNGRIFNPDSLPKGTRTNRIVIKPEFSDVSKAEVLCRLYTGVDTTYEYSERQTDTINFEAGPVFLKLTALDGVSTMSYRIDINIHQMDPDLYTWDRFGTMNLGLNKEEISESKMVERGDSLFLMVAYTDATRGAELFVGSGNGIEKWERYSQTLPADALVTEFVAANDAFYLVADDKLYSCTDFKVGVWTDCSVAMYHIYGAAESMLLGVEKRGNAYFHVTYPATVESPVAENCPVEATSGMLTYVSEWSLHPMSIFTGGRLADGSVSGASWGYDGTSWQQISMAPMQGRTNMAVVPYFTFRVATNWQVTEQSVLFAIGGSAQADATEAATTYISYDRGVHWAPASENVQLPGEIGLLKVAQAYTIGATLGVEPQVTVESRLWRSMEMPCRMSRAVTPIIDWTCPYIYIYDPEKATIWRGVINRLTFRPLQ